MYTQAVEFGYALLSRVSRHTAWKHFQQLQRNQWLSDAELRLLQWRRLSDLLRYAKAEIPFYRDLWRTHGVDPARFRSLEDFHELPIVAKPDLIRAQEQDAFRLSARSGVQMTHTSGTTGPRLYVPFNADDLQIKYAAYLRAYYATGWRLGMRSAALHYHGHPEFAGKYTGERDEDTFPWIRTAVFKVAHRRALLEPYHTPLTGDDRFAASWYRSLRRHRPYLLETMDLNLLLLDDYIKRKGLTPLGFPKVIALATFSSALKERLGNAFQTEIFDRYGPHEIEGVAFACEKHSGMHLATDCVHVEILDDAYRPLPPRETGHIVLTDLYSRLMPLIRYQIGDHGHYFSEPCGCGRGFPLIGEIDGRTRDLLELRSGRKIPPSRLCFVFHDEPSVRLFQIVQHAAGRIQVNIVPDHATYDDEIGRALRSKVLELVGEDEDVSIKPVESLPIESNGKFSFIARTESNHWQRKLEIERPV